MDEITLKVGTRVRGEVDGRQVDITITRITMSGAPDGVDWVTTTPSAGKVRLAGEAPEARTGEWAQNVSDGKPTTRANSVITMTDPA